VGATGFWLEVEGRRFPIEGEKTTVGRDPYCDIVVSAESVSRKHAVFHMTPEGLFLEDLGAKNGTFVNGKRLSGQTQLALGDLLGLGKVAMQLVAIEPAPRPRAHPTMGLSREMAATSEDEPVTTANSLLDQIEPLIGRAFDAGRPPDLFATIHNLVDTFLADIERRGQRLALKDATRIAAVADLLAAWSDDKTYRNWRDHVFDLIEQHRPGATKRKLAGK